MIDRCVCSDVTFTEMKSVIDGKGLNSYEQLKQHLSFGRNCALCVPYVKLIFTTGKTEFEPIIYRPENDE